MQQCEYCELWWTDGGSPLLTFYKPEGTEMVAVNKGEAPEEVDSWEALESAVTQLGLSGWELISAAHHGTGLFFKRHLQ